MYEDDNKVSIKGRDNINSVDNKLFYFYMNKRKLYRKCEMCQNVFLVSSNSQRFCGRPEEYNSCSYKNKSKQALLYRKNNPKITKKINRNQVVRIIELRKFYNKYKDLVKNL